MTPNGKGQTHGVINRRGFLRRVEVVATAAVCGGKAALPLLAAACGGARYVAATRTGMQLVLGVSEIPSGGGAIVEVGDGELPLYVRRLAGGGFSAVSTRCMHLGCQVEPAGDRMVCPCHGSEYTLDGMVLRGPTELPLIRYRVTSDDSKLYIHLDSPLSGTRS